MSESTSADAASATVLAEDQPDVDLIELLVPLLRHWKLLLIAPLLAGLAALGATYLIPKTYTSRTVFLPPQQQQSAAAAALAQLGALSGLAGAAAGVRTPGDQYVALLQSQTVADRIVDAFGLIQVYESDFRFEARKELAENSRIGLGRKDGLISIEVDDAVPQRAADIANRYVEELRRLSNEIALTEAQQRRSFFEQQLGRSRDQLTRAQQALQASGFNPGALRADARAAAESYARARAEVTAAEIRLQGLRLRLADSAPEVQASLAALQTLRAQQARLEGGASGPESGPDYISKFREFKYQETLFDLFARQYEMARLDEAREGALIQVVDVARPAEWKSRPKRAVAAVATTLVTLFALAAFVIVRHLLRRQPGPTVADRLRAARTR
jgi:uncharacterized protein involved in exopolysaccharide biosynthesis